MRSINNRCILPFFVDVFNIEWYGKLFLPSNIDECVLPSLPRQCIKWNFLYIKEPRKLMLVQVILKNKHTHTDYELLIGLTRYFKEVELLKTEALDRICDVILKFK